MNKRKQKETGLLPRIIVSLVANVLELKLERVSKLKSSCADLLDRSTSGSSPHNLPA